VRSKKRRIAASRRFVHEETDLLRRYDGRWLHRRHRSRVDAFVNEGDHVTEYCAAIRSYDTIVMGRRTYEFGLRFGVADPYPWADTVVCGHFVEPPSSRVRFVTDGVTEVERLKRGDGAPIYLCGGGELASALFDARLIDELILKVSPVVLGQGIPLAARLTRAPTLALRACKTYANGVVVSHYDVRH
jgi:dihydrofolate reductase